MLRSFLHDAVLMSLYLVVRTILDVAIAGSVPLFMVVVVNDLLFATAIGIFLGTMTNSMSHWLGTVMQAFPSTHFVSFAQSILYRAAGLSVVWP